MTSVVIIDDQKHVRELLIEEIEEMGYQAYGFEPEINMLEPIKKLKPDMVILDPYVVPYDDFKIFRDLKEVFPKTPTIIFTVLDASGSGALVSQADAYIVKSSVLEPLKKAIATLLSKENDTTHEAPN